MHKGETEVVPALEARDLRLTWDGVTTVVENLSFAVMPGETVCMLGRSGCGKTTILHALAGLTHPQSGTVLVGGTDVTGTPGAVSYMFQRDLLLPHKSVLDNACLPLVLDGMGRAEARERARSLFARFGLEGTEEQWPAQLSGGMRQRVAFLRTYLTGNAVALLDEPFSALDAMTRAELRSWYAEMAGELGIATLMVTHDVDEGVVMGDRVLVLAGNPRAGKPSHVVAEVSCGSSAGERRHAKEAVEAALA